ncbi:hypothetical protein H0H92_001424 [Tricholoma furcatifolium]|nr:hypothetical protein H0H92_001424 [Tricholoma furcatifolium]
MLTSTTIALLLAGVVSASPLKRTSYPAVITECTVPNTAALTFAKLYSKDVSDTLKAAGAVGTFFMNGNNWDCIYDDDVAPNVLYALQSGHQIAAHTWSHPDLTTLNEQQITSQFQLINDALVKIAGVTPAFVRPPYGNYNELVQQVAANFKQNLINWDFDSGDSTGSTPAQSNAMYDALVKKHPSNVLALNHETYNTTVFEVLPHAIQVLQGAGYKLVSVAECLGMEPYLSQVQPSQRDVRAPNAFTASHL